MLLDMPREVMADRNWRAALTILCDAFPTGHTAWDHIEPGVRIDWRPIVTDLRACEQTEDETLGERMLICFAASLVSAEDVPLGNLAKLAAPAMNLDALRVFCDALAIARGEPLPVFEPPLDRTYRRAYRHAPVQRVERVG